MENYAIEVLKRIDANHLIPHRLFRNSCSVVKGNLIKNLAHLGRDLKDVVIIDNSSLCYSMQPCNGIPIKTWISDKNDVELKKLTPILELLSKVNDVRDYLREVVVNNKIDCEEAMKLLKGEKEIPRLEFSLDSICSSIEYMKSLTIVPKLAEESKKCIKRRAESEVLIDKLSEKSITDIDDMPIVIHIGNEISLKETEHDRIKKIPCSLKNTLEKDFTRLTVNTR